MQKRWIETGLPAKLKALKKLQNDNTPPRALFIFRRDLRIFDNKSLLTAAKTFSISPIFILTPEQVNENSFKSSNCIQFMVQSLIDLQHQIEREGGNFYVFYGNIIDVLQDISSKNKVSAIFFNKDYTPYSLDRDKSIEEWAGKKNIECHSYHDTLLIDDFDLVKSSNGTPYFLFSHFFNKASSFAKRKCDFEKVKSWANLDADNLPNFKEFMLKSGFYAENADIFLQGGRKEGLELLNTACKSLKNYSATKNDLLSHGTTRLSAHNKFGTLSIREIYYSLKDAYGDNCDVIKQLYWRDFFYYLGHFHPAMYTGAPIPSKQHFNEIKWSYNDPHFEKWCKGETGFPLVDAGMRQMNRTGYMHNRARMVVAMFLTKDILLDWRAGEKYFSQKLIDVDRAQNCGNWAWCAGTGADGSPWLRIFNPWTQQKKLDPEAAYIKKWVPELAQVGADDIINWDEAWKKHKGVYFKPMVDHKVQRDLCYAAYGVKRSAKQKLDE